ncbi:selenide, water dikinase SelD [Pseudanabaena sp. FACHB-2040]|uniref:selenide, water dikinase SelD n=1 Tax=Pseudanabaena sp. FACHB-2040 TaxID=2692859 RepID=UPI001683A38E|nr:selenide, water dikinase SelD [Pseudanabaena sp. FACHB-2040]MBD2258544.1 selenide, water dikinase SelD [Pseudanabaena sp. FACHB-2040]
MQATQPITTDVVLVGGGHTHAIVLRKLGMVALPGVRLTLITNLADTPYSGMLPCHIAGVYGFDESHIDLRPLTRFARCRLFMDRAIGLDLEKQQVICANHPPVRYDVLSLDTGSTPGTVAVPGAAEYTIPAKPVPELLRQWDQILAAVRQAPDQPLTLGVVGAGVGGVELTLNLQERLRNLLTELGRSLDQVTIHVFHRGDTIATGRNGLTRRRLQQIFRERGIQLHLSETVVAVEPSADGSTQQVICESGRRVKCDRIFWVTSAAAPAWLQDSGLSLDDEGFVEVRDTLQSCSHGNVFAAGDVATMVNHPRPKAGVFAVRQGPPLFKNLVRYLQGQPLQPFRPQRRFLNIIDIGGGSAIASRGPFTVESPLARQWKDRIDRKFMRLFTDFPDMANPRELSLAESAPPTPAMFCAGCGSKVGSGALRRALRRVTAELPPVAGTSMGEILLGLEAPDDAAVVTVPTGKVMLHTVDYFRAMLDDPFVFAQICVNHCLSDLYAMGAEPQSALALAVVPYASEALQEETLYQLLAGVQKALGAAAAPLVGGHTTEGAELALGFACNGLADPAQLLRKGGMQLGDHLILTKPLGTGTLFAADMRQQAKGRWIEGAVAQMLHSNREAAYCFQAHGATACTDVTGFGLLGHLLEMVQAAQVSVELDLSQLPVLAGARETLALGIVSSLQTQNEAAAIAIDNREPFTSRPDYPLLFDPQTAGGLIASVPADQAAACLEALQIKGYRESTVIGEVIPLKNSAQPIKISKW